MATNGRWWRLPPVEAASSVANGGGAWRTTTARLASDYGEGWQRTTAALATDRGGSRPVVAGLAAGRGRGWQRSEQGGQSAVAGPVAASR